MSTIALSSYSFGPDCTATMAIDFALVHGFRGLELGSWTLWPESMSRAETNYVRVQAAANGIDLSCGMIRQAQERRGQLPNVGFEVADAEPGVLRKLAEQGIERGQARAGGGTRKVLHLAGHGGVVEVVGVGHPPVAGLEYPRWPGLYLETGGLEHVVQ